MTHQREDPVGVALLGCAHIHMADVVQVFAARSDARVRAVWDAEPARAERWAAALGALHLDDQSRIWRDPGVEAVVVMSETSRHVELVTSAAQAGKDIYLEKPLAVDAAGARSVAEAVTRADVKFHVGYHLRQVPAHQALRELVRRGRLGRIVRLRGRFAHNGALQGIFADCPWMMEPEAAGFGGFGDLGVHLLDLLCLLADCPVLEVAAHVDPGPRPGRLDHTGDGMLHFSDGAVGIISAGWTEHPSPVTLEVHGTAGWATVTDGVLIVEPPAEDLPSPEVVRPRAGAALDHFLDALVGKDVPPLVEVAAAARHVELLTAMYRAAGRRTWVPV